VGRKSACSVHLDEDEKEDLTRIWDQVVAGFDCPGWAATAGQECNEDSLVLVDGFYPTPKAFNGRNVHTSACVDYKPRRVTAESRPDS
jgi:hypothetical protein